jgi:hypothetical protein
MADIANITNHPADDYATLDCGPALSKKLHHTPAVWDRNRKCWLVATDDVSDLISWLRREGVIVVVDSIRRDPPQPAPYVTRHVDWHTQTEVNARGIAAARAALHQAKDQP